MSLMKTEPGSLIIADQEHTTTTSGTAKPSSTFNHLLAAGLALSVTLLQPQAANALVINVDGNAWDVQTSSPLDFALANSLQKLDQQDWWSDAIGSSGQARKFADAVTGQLGRPNFGSQGPYFAYASLPPIPGGTYRCYWFENSGGAGGGSTDCGRFDSINTATWAYATQVPGVSKVPGPLPLFGAATAFGFSRKLRKRIKSSKLLEASLNQLSENSMES